MNAKRENQITDSEYRYTSKRFDTTQWLLALILLLNVAPTHCLAQPSQPLNLAPGTTSSPGPVVFSSNGRNVTFSWSQTTGTASYLLNVRDVTSDPNGPLYNFTNNGATSTSLVLTLSNHGAYKWNVYACSGANATGTKTLSATEWFRFLNPPSPVSPGGSNPTPVQTVLTLTNLMQWSTVPQADGYWLYISQYPYGLSHIIYSQYFSSSSTASWAPPQGALSPGTPYAWNMTSLFGSTESSPSSALYFTTDTLPTAPNTLSASGGSSQIGLGWNYTSANAYGQKLERKDGANGSWNQIADLNWNVGGYTDYNVSLGVTYYYRIHAYNGIGNSATNYSSGASLTLPVSISVTDPNSGQSLQAGSTYTVSFTSSGSTASISYYDFAYSLDGGPTYSTPASGISSGAIGYSWTVPNCTSTVQGRVRVRAFNSSNTVIGIGVNPSNFTITAPSGGLPTARADVTTTSPNTGQYITFSGSRSLSANSCTPIVSYSWTFPDGTYTSASPYLIRSFSTPSTSFTATLTVQDSVGNTSTAYLPITVSGWGQGVSSSSSFSHDPVNLANGNYVYAHTDLHIPGKGFPFEFKRFYNSQFSDQTGQPLGYGWTDNYNILLSTTPTNATVTFGDGHSETYYLINGQYQGGAGVYGILATNSDGSFTLTAKDQTKQNFTAQGRLVSIVDKNTNTLSLSYSDGTLTNITDTAGRQITFQNDANGRITQISDPIGRLIQFQYDGTSNLVAAIDANLSTNIFLYDANHQMTDARDARGTWFVHNTYDALQRIVNYQSDAYTNQSGFFYDFANHVTYVTNVFGKASIYRHDNNLLVTNIVDEAGNQQFFSYDTNRNRIFIQDKNGNQTQYGYDSLGNVTNKIDALNDVTSIQYDALNNPIRRIDALAKITTFGYDSRGNLTSTTNALNFASQVQYDTSGLPIILTDARGFSTTNQYDSQGNLTNVIDAHGFATRVIYDGVGRKIRQIDVLNHATLFDYDNDDNLLYTTNALGFVNAFTYDGNNNRISSTDPRGATVTNVFDLKDRLVAVLAPLNQTNGMLYDALDRKVVTFDALGNQTGYAYDDIGNLVAVTNALNQVTRFTYDSQGNQTSVIDPTGHYVTNFFDTLNRKVATIDAFISTNLTAYDALGRVTATTNANGQVTQFFYDAIGRLTNVVDSANQFVFFAYDQNGNRILTTDPNGHSWTNILDKLNRLVEQDDPLGHKATFHYDPVGNLTNKVTANGDSITYSYDALNRLANIAYPSGQPVTFTYDSVGNRTNMVDSLGTTTWQFDLLNHLKSVTDPYGQTVANGFDANGNRVSLTYPGNKVVNYGFDALNRISTLTNWLNGVVTYGYDGRGNLIAANNANCTTAACAYDVANRLVALTNAAPDASVIAAYAVTLDGVGNHTQATHNQPLFPILSNQTNNFAYDSDNRLATIDGQTVTHNANGDLTGIGTNSYVYDFEDRLVQSSFTNISSTFTYDGLGNRLARTVNGQVRRFVLDGMGALTQVLVETDTNNSPVAYYVYGLGLGERISASGTVATYHFNIQGSTIALTDSGGKVSDSYAYDSFGVLANSDGDSPQPFHYLGQYGIVDDSIGLLYARARYFSPQLGRFLTKDPVIGKDSNGQSLNRYVYALNSPLNLIDISGLSPLEGRVFTASSATDAEHIQLLMNERERRLYILSLQAQDAHQNYLNALAVEDAYYKAAINYFSALDVIGTVSSFFTGIGEEGIAAKGVTSVYTAVENGAVKYVGITDNLSARAAAHLSEKGIVIDEIPGLSGLSRSDARSVEQVLIEKYGLGKNGGSLLNKINSISKDNPIYEDAIQRGTELLKQIQYPGF
jgi:RHS repeat-associated protein